MSLYDQLAQGVSNFSPNGNPQMGGAQMGLTPQTGNPIFQSQIDLNVQTVASQIIINARKLEAADPVHGVFYDINVDQTPSNALPAELFGDSLPVVIFGNSDYAAGYNKALSLNPSSVCKFVGAYTVDQNGFAYSVGNTLLGATALGTTPTVEFYSEAVKEGIAKMGDIILLYISPVTNGPGGGNLQSGFYTAEVVISCPQVSYATLLDSLNSDTFVIDGIRYTIPDVTKIDQFGNAIGNVRQSLFGKLTSDSMNPNSMNMPFNNQTNIIDVPITMGVDKNLIVNTRINTTCRKFIWSLFIKTTQKIKA